VVLDEVVDSLLGLYSGKAGIDSSGAEVIEATIVEELQLEECAVSPDNLYSCDEIVTLLANNNSSASDIKSEEHTEIPEQRSLLSSRYADDRLYLSNLLSHDEESELIVNNQTSDISEVVIRVRTVEALTVIEDIPFSIEYVDDNTKYVNQSEITSPGKDGKKEVVYHLVRENGLEIERIVIEEIILEEPETQIESIGRKELASQGSSNFTWPVQGEGIIYPNQGFRPGHSGIDIHIAHGTNVLAADSGTVVYSGWGSTQGNYLILQHGGYWTLYLHNSAHLVKQGDRVTKGQAIAKVGATGRATGSHLHFEIRVDDGTRKWNSYYQHQPVDPMQFYRR
jgi:murein DD-endopeptidase MepM/ murein hydrolase activator NlpD